MFLTVYLSNSEQHFTEVPVTPETTGRDLVELCKETGESDCHLAEVWRGSGMRLAQPLGQCVHYRDEGPALCQMHWNMRRTLRC